MARVGKYRRGGSSGRKIKSASHHENDEIKFMSVAGSSALKNKDGKHKEAIRMPHLTSTKSQITAMGKCDWGITAPDKLGIKTSVVKKNSDWQLKVTKVNSVVRSFSRLLPGQKEPVPGVNTTKDNFKDQINELNKLGTCAGKWYMIRAVVAHENVHVKEWRDNFKTDWIKQKNIIEGLKVAATGENTKSNKAHKTLRAMPAFENARLTSNSSGNYPVFWGLADPNKQTNNAEKAIVAPRIKWICKYAKWNKWNPAGSPACTSLKIT